MNYLKKIINWPAFPSLLLLMVLVIINSIVSKGFLSTSAWLSFLQTVAPIVILSIGQAVVIIGGGIDISNGMTVSLVNTIMATTSNFEGSALLPVSLSLVAGLGVGLLNGLLVSVARINPLLVTFAVSFVCSGAALMILPIPGGQVPMSLYDLFSYNILGFFPMVIVFIVIVCVTWRVWQRSALGVHLYALGNNQQKAYFSGINVPQIQSMTYVFSGFTASVAGIVLSSNILAGDARVGNAMTLTSIAACVVGGIPLAGGGGSVYGAIFGSLFLNLVLITVMGMGVPAYFQDLVAGLIVMLGLVGSLVILKKKRAKHQVAADVDVARN
jgi:ribose transport system permease protein